jgi:internalin A
VLYGCPFEDLPVEVCGESYGDNIIDAVRAHFADLELGETQDRELKVFVLGNAGVGKTQLCRRLCGLHYDPLVPSTHGIQLGHREVTLRDNKQPVRLNFWDFGGQDIYYGSHALFLQGQAIFLLLWTPDREAGEYEEGGMRLRHRPLAYWLDWVRSLVGTDSPVLIIQSQCDHPRQRQHQLQNRLPTEDFRYLRPFEFSAHTDLGLDLLEAQLKEAVRDVLDQHSPVAIGQGRVVVRNHLRALLEEDQERPPGKRCHRTLTWEGFQGICQQTGKVSNPRMLLDYLHHTGVVFYRPGLFDNRIILDQSWALDAIYTLFHRERTLSVLYRHGRFTRRELEVLIWGAFSVAEQELFLSMMESCGICFRARSNLSKDLAHPEWEYFAPELLPEWSGVQDQLLGRLREGQPDAEARAHFRFLHEGILRGLLGVCRTYFGTR